MTRGLGFRDPKWILNEKGEPVPCPDVKVWGPWYEATCGPDSDGVRRVARDEIDGTVVSTVFTALDANWGDGPPVLWETAAWGPLGSIGKWWRRHTSRADAEEWHRQVVAQVKGNRGN
jgi:hypothetical protein